VTSTSGPIASGDGIATLKSIEKWKILRAGGRPNRTARKLDGQVGGKRLSHTMRPRVVDEGVEAVRQMLSRHAPRRTDRSVGWLPTAVCLRGWQLLREVAQHAATIV
jgi:hypothetical protein